MARRILKYTLNTKNETVEMPLGAKIISAGVQGTGPNTKIVLWAEVTDGDQVGTRDVVAMPTGLDTFNYYAEYRFIDTVQLVEQGLVFHIYELDYNYVESYVDYGITPTMIG